MPAAQFLPRNSKEWLRAAALAAAYAVCAKLSLRLAIVHPNATPVWPPTGIAIASFLILGRSITPAIFAGAFVANLTTAGNAATSLAIAAGNTLEGMAAAWLVERYAGGRSFCERPRDILRFAGSAAASPVISATVGVAALTAAGFAQWSTDAKVWLTWWLGDAGGALVVTPFLVQWLGAPLPRLEGRKLMEVSAAYSAVFAVSWAVFGGLLPRHAPLTFLCIPPVIWAARFGPRKTATACLIVSGAAVAGAVRGIGPFAGTGANESLLVLQIFVGTTSLIGLLFAAEAAEVARANSALRHAYDELDVLVKRRTDDLSRANAELEMFAAVASHDLQAPIHKITSFAELLEKRSGGLDDVGKDMLRRMHRAGERMSRLVEDLLSLTRVIRDPKPFERVDLDAVLKDVLADLETRIEENKAVVDSAPLPTVRAHPTQMRQLLQNLIGNAIKFRDPKRELKVRVESRARGDGFLELSVSDTGIGFDPAQAERIFQPFVSLYVSGEYAGSGIGLAICRRIAVRHGGAISAKSEPGKGSVFTVILPYSG